VVDKKSPAAKNRYIWYGGQLNALPNSIGSVFPSLRMPAMKGLMSGALLELFRKQRNLEIPDETVGSFMTRRLNKHIAQNLVSAMVHGIYAGDVDALSMRSLFPVQWRHEMLYGSITRGMISGKKIQVYEDIMLRDELYWPNHETLSKIKDASVYSFKGGIETLSKALVKELEASENVIIKTNTPVTSIRYEPGEDDFEPFTVTPLKPVIFWVTKLWARLITPPPPPTAIPMSSQLCLLGTSPLCSPPPSPNSRKYPPSPS
jgi:oxygen-dependent protoporphyrinogen oxidase